MNGAQVQALAGIVQAVSNRTLAPAAAREMMFAAFPLMPRDRVEKIITEASSFTPPVNAGT